MAENEKCSGNCSSCDSKQKEEDCQLKLAMSRITHKIVVMSGKGGVGKSTVAVNLAMALALDGKRVGLLDVDIHGPSVPTMLNLEKSRPETNGQQLIPVAIGSLKVMSIGFLLDNRNEAVIWRGPVKMGVIKQLLTEVDWGELDYLIVDCPPGTGDEPLTVCQLLPDADGALIVTTPQQVAAADVAKSLSFCNQLGFTVLGIIENMSGFVCPKCGEVTEIFASGAGASLADAFQVPLLGKIPIDPRICRSGDAGNPFIHGYADSPVAAEFKKIVAQLEK